VPAPVLAVQVPLTPLVGNVVLQSQMLVAARHEPVTMAELVAELGVAEAGQVAVKVVAVPVLAGKKLALQVGTHAGDPNVAGKADEVQPPATELAGSCAVTWAKVHVCATHVPVTIVRPVAPLIAPAAQVSDNVPE